MLIILLLIVLCLVRSVNALGIGKWGLTTTTRRLTFTTIHSNSVVDEYNNDEGRSPTFALFDALIVVDDDYDDDNLLPTTPPTTTTWDVADDWNSLSSSAVVSGIFTLNNDNNDDDDNSIDDVAGSAAGRWESSSPIIDDDDEESTTDQHGITTLRNIMNTDDADFVEDAIESISNNLDYNDPDDLVGLYDAYFSTSASTMSTTTRTTTTTTVDDNRMNKSMKELMKEEEEIALVVRCDRSPIGLLVEQGKALPELTTAMKYSPRHLLMSTSTSDDDDDDDDDDKGMLLPLKPKATPFLDNAIRRIFSIYSTEGIDDAIMDRDAIAKWMTTCISSPLPPPSTLTTVIDKEYSAVVANKAIDNIGPYDRDVSAVLSRYSQKFGSGRLTLPEFSDLYLEATWAGYINDITQKKISLYDDDSIDDVNNETSSRRYYKFPSPNVGILFQDRKNTEGMILKLASLSIVWRDLEAHGIFSPAEEERVRTLLEMERLHPSSTTDDSNRNNNNNLHPSLMDECVLFDEYEERLSRRNSEDNDDVDDIMGVESAWDFLKRKDGGREKSSHELVEMTTDGKTPKRIRDGQFVFIDEETCIGCAQVCTYIMYFILFSVCLSYCCVSHLFFQLHFAMYLFSVLKSHHQHLR
jgi:NAD-dependent dihydropyrimidine dehydrogenase PreA subunit